MVARVVEFVAVVAAPALRPGPSSYRIPDLVHYNSAVHLVALA